MEPALPVDYSLLERIAVDGDVMNMSAEEYLAWVRNEADNLPGVVRVEAQSKQMQLPYMPQVDEIQICPDEYLPDEDWANAICFKFSQLRSELYRRSLSIETRERKFKVPAMKDEISWEHFCLGSSASKEIGFSPPTPAADASDLEEGEIPQDRSVEAPPSSNDSIEECTDSSLSAAKHSIITEFQLDDGTLFHVSRPDKKTVTTAFSVVNVEIIDPSTDSVEVDGGALVESYESNVPPTIPLLLQFDQVLTSLLFSYHVNWTEELRELSHARGLWLYALMARLLKPLPGETASTMRQLYRSCCRIRSILVSDYESLKSAVEIKSGLKYGPLERNLDDFITNHNSSVSADEDFETNLALLNTIIVLTGLYFGQGEEFAQLSET